MNVAQNHTSKWEYWATSSHSSNQGLAQVGTAAYYCFSVDLYMSSCTTVCRNGRCFKLFDCRSLL